MEPSNFSTFSAQSITPLSTQQRCSLQWQYRCFNQCKFDLSIQCLHQCLSTPCAIITEHSQFSTTEISPQYDDARRRGRLAQLTSIMIALSKGSDSPSGTFSLNQALPPQPPPLPPSLPIVNATQSLTDWLTNSDATIETPDTTSSTDHLFIQAASAAGTVTSLFDSPFAPIEIEPNVDTESETSPQPFVTGTSVLSTLQSALRSMLNVQSLFTIQSNSQPILSSNPSLLSYFTKFDPLPILSSNRNLQPFADEIQQHRRVKQFTTPFAEALTPSHGIVRGIAAFLSASVSSSTSAVSAGISEFVKSFLATRLKDSQQQNSWSSFLNGWTADREDSTLRAALEQYPSLAQGALPGQTNFLNSLSSSSQLQVQQMQTSLGSVASSFFTGLFGPLLSSSSPISGSLSFLNLFDLSAFSTSTQDGSTLPTSGQVSNQYCAQCMSTCRQQSFSFQICTGCGNSLNLLQLLSTLVLHFSHPPPPFLQVLFASAIASPIHQLVHHLRLLPLQRIHLQRTPAAH